MDQNPYESPEHGEKSGQPQGGNVSPMRRQAAFGSVVGALVGAAIGALSGQFIDTLLTDEPYAGVRLGGFLGALIGAQIGGGHGLVGVSVMLFMVACSAIGVILPMVAFWWWRPVPMDHWIVILVSCLGGIGGAVVGLAAGVIAIDPRRKQAGHKPFD